MRLIGRATENLGYLVLGAFFVALLIGVAAFLLPSRNEKWPSVAASVIDVRVVRDKLGIEGTVPIPVYKGEVLLEYWVNGQSYTLWTNTGIMERDSGWVRQHIPMTGYRVRYNSMYPEEAEAERPAPN
jgi:hypothetical protein